MTFTEIMISEMKKKNPKLIEREFLDAKGRAWIVSFDPCSFDPYGAALTANISAKSGDEEIDIEIPYVLAVTEYYITRQCSIEVALKDAIIRAEEFD